MQDNFNAIYYYDKVGGIYDKETHPVLGDPASEYSQGFAALISYLKPSSILEIGCGTGKRFKSIFHYYRMKNYSLPKLSAIEPAEGMRAQIPEELKSNMDLYSDIDTSRFDDNSFDLVLTSGVLCSIQNAEAVHVAKESFRLAKMYSLHTDTPKDRPHLNDLDLLGFFIKAGAQVVFWDTILPYPFEGEHEHRIVLQKTKDVHFPETFPLRSQHLKYDETWEEILTKRLNQ